MLERYEKLIHQGELPRLRIVPISNVLFHEEIEPARLRRVAARLEEDGVLRHPPIVAGTPRGRRLILVDGAHRISALRELGLKYALVQIVRYDDDLIELQRWHHLLDMENPKAFLAAVRAIPGVEISSCHAAPDASPIHLRRHQYAQIILPDRTGLLVNPADGRQRTDPHWLDGAAAVLRPLCRLYKERGFRDRISYDEFDWIETNYDRFTALVIFPHFTKNEIARVARSKEKLPAGITRHLIPKRALRFDLPLWILSRKLPVTELNRRLVETILNRIQEGRIRFYSESTFSFNE
jgi:hypothetical protein